MLYCLFVFFWSSNSSFQQSPGSLSRFRGLFSWGHVTFLSQELWARHRNVLLQHFLLRLLMAWKRDPITALWDLCLCRLVLWEWHNAMESYSQPKSWSDITTSSTLHKLVLVSIPDTGLCCVGRVNAPRRSLVALTRPLAKLNPISFSPIHWKKAQEHPDTKFEKR